MGEERWLSKERGQNTLIDCSMCEDGHVRYPYYGLAKEVNLAEFDRRRFFNLVFTLSR